jgi:hypothetical protein
MAYMLVSIFVFALLKIRELAFAIAKRLIHETAFISAAATAWCWRGSRYAII